MAKDLSAKSSNFKVYKKFLDRVNSPGKFQGELPYVPYYWEYWLNGFFDFDNEKYGCLVTGWYVTAEDKQLFPELKKRRTVKIIEEDTGFVTEVKF